MKKRITLLVMGLALVWGLTACASGYGIPDGGPHFRSWDHFQYSVWWVGEKRPLTQEQNEKAKEEGWWGVPVRYTPDEVR